MKRLVGALGLAVLAACGSDSESGGPASTAATSTTAAPATAAPTTATPTTATPTTAAPTSTTAPTTQPAPPTSATPAPPTGADPTSGTAVVYASAGDEFGWLPVGWWDGAEWGSAGGPTPEVVTPESPVATWPVRSVAVQ